MGVKESKTCPICCLDFQMAYGTGQKRWATQIYCGQKCYQLSRFGRPHPTSIEIIPIEVRFWEKVDKNGEIHPQLGTRCWLWNGAKHTAGYGRVSKGHRDGMLPATHVSWMIHRGEEVPKGMVIMHKCDNPPCCNPDHLLLGTHRQNNDDKMAKGRNVPPPRPLSGQDNMFAKLSTADVLAIKEMWNTDLPAWGDGRIGHRKEIMSKFSVSATTVKAIVAGKRRVNG